MVVEGVSDWKLTRALSDCRPIASQPLSPTYDNKQQVTHTEADGRQSHTYLTEHTTLA
jgi:hypothetical protein